MNPKLRILHLEDSENDAELVNQILVREGFDFTSIRLSTLPEFMQELQKKDFDLILSDCSMPEFSGLHALEVARLHAPETPFIFVSGTMGEEAAIESLRNGATDYVLKQRLSRLAPAVRRAMAETDERIKNQVMEQRLRQAQRLEAVGTLAGGVAHDFNNILTIIAGHLALLPLECRDPQRVQEIGVIIDRATQRGTDLVKQLLAFARKSDGSFTSTDINQHIREITGMLRKAVPKNIEFEFQLDEGLPLILADPAQVERVVVNLATNARDAMPNGGTITFSTGQVPGAQLPPHSPMETNQDYLRLCVTDTGIGMSETMRQHIFEPFFTTKPKSKGTGLGLSVVYGLMQSHNGIIDVQSEPGKGTSISLFFPIPAGGAPRLPEKALNTPSAVNGTETVLIVDDEEDVIYFLEIILGQHGYHVLSAKNAEEAIEVFQVHQDEIELLFSDLGLPKLDGFGLSDYVRKLKPGLKTILASGYIDAAVKTRMTEEHVDGFITKPYNTQSLLQTIRTILDKKRPAGLEVLAVL